MEGEKGLTFPALGPFLDNVERLANLLDLVIEPIGGSSHPGKTPRLRKLINPTEPETIDAPGTGSSFLFQWSAVMFVTITETYLQDTLVFAAEIDPELMAKSEMQATFKQISEVNDIEELRDSMRQRWARSFIDDGGPPKWMDRFRRMGANYVDANDSKMTLLWGLRHLIVHKAGIVNKDFIVRYPDLQQTINTELQISRKVWGDLISNCGDFVRETNLYFSNRYYPEMKILYDKQINSGAG